tara:strand:+ start:777 stop:2201 length:1425 start_codon:yes stop_codon:yes gene_type:complete
MAEEFVEANVFQVPDLVGAANQQQRQKKQEELRTLGYLDRYQKKNGRYLTAHQPLVQERWNSVVKAMDAVAANDNINTRRALGEAYTGYSKVAGEAQFVAQEYASERKYLSENANKLAMSVADADAQLQQLNNTAINEMQLSELATNPMSLRLPRAYQSSIVGTVKQGQNLASLSRAKLNNEWLATGKLDMRAAERWADEWASQNYTKGQEDEMVAQVLVADNIKGRNGRLEIGEFAQIQAMPQEDKDRYVAMYIDRAKQNFLDNLPRTAKVSGSGGSDSTPKVMGITQLFVGEDEVPIPVDPDTGKKKLAKDPIGPDPAEGAEIVGVPGKQRSVRRDEKVIGKGTPGEERSATQIGLANIKPIKDGLGGYIFGFGISEDGKPVVYKSKKGQVTDSFLTDSGIADQTAAERAASFNDAKIETSVSPAKREDLLALKSFLGAEFDTLYRAMLRSAGVETMSDEDYMKYLNQEFPK